MIFQLEFGHWVPFRRGDRSQKKRPSVPARDHTVCRCRLSGVDCLDRTVAEAAGAARERYGYPTLRQSDPATYGRAAMRADFHTCEKALTARLRDLHSRRLPTGRIPLMARRRLRRLLA